MDLTVLFRPVGQAEYELIEASGFRRFPPRLPEQPYFYPVLNEGYATQIARDWNTKHSKSKVGYVLRLSIQSAFLQRYSVHQVGASKHLEYWIPAGELEEFNDHIIGRIEVIGIFRTL